MVKLWRANLAFFWSGFGRKQTRAWTRQSSCNYVSWFLQSVSYKNDETWTIMVDLMRVYSAYLFNTLHNPRKIEKRFQDGMTCTSHFQVSNCPIYGLPQKKTKKTAPSSQIPNESRPQLVGTSNFRTDEGLPWIGPSNQSCYPWENLRTETREMNSSPAVW